ncbi:hypothetical protein BIV57_04560 [Mangrovactinospora gilvigrisea]|uniref:NlpC/P60 domain-containing protein n=1 Tax=Mangrovactinospora gilvigrisea TaxID=1428644 RepID=A0A1J7BYV7_9ACTN|nr:hypothetical protein [Mangrovactinospora gilvigrisea]OIV38665.1 hypothetical protein BIV57_04560 [Mangrovactinospora gilvigrisea]
MTGGELRLPPGELRRLRRVCSSEAEALAEAARAARELLEHPAFRAGLAACPEEAARVGRLVHRAVDGDAGLPSCARRVRRSAEELAGAEEAYRRAERHAAEAARAAASGSNYGKPWGHGWLPADAHAAHLAHAQHRAHLAHAGRVHGGAAHGDGGSAPEAGASGRRAAILERAARWAAQRVPYTMYGYHGGWRADCSGFVSMAWQLHTSMTTVTLPEVAHRVLKAQLRPGDVLLNKAPGRHGHVVLFERWTDESHTSYLAYEQSPGGTKHRVVPYPYFPGHGAFEPYRLNALGR